MALQPGDQAPDFTLYDDARQPWTLSEHLAGGKVVLLFFPGAFTSVCTDELTTASNNLDAYRRLDAQVVGISTDAPGVLAEFRKVNRISFPLLSDHDAEVAHAYGARFSREEHNLGYSRIAKRASFAVGVDGAVLYADVLAHPGLLPDFDALLAAIGEGATPA